jgi:general secretion pathway protein J
MAPLRPDRAAGFTLIELLVAISIMALMAVLSWRGLDGMAQTQSRLQQRADDVLALQAGLAQWGSDLDALVPLEGQPALDWDGRALRLTRRASVPSDGNSAANTGELLMVVAWTRREVNGAGQWLRWQSPPLQTRGELQTAWSAAAQWGQNPGEDLKAREVRIVTLAGWQVFYFRGDAWSNPLSDSGNLTTDASAPSDPASGTGGGATGGTGVGAGSGASLLSVAANSLRAAQRVAGVTVPQGVRLVLTLPPGQAISGTLVRDWVLPTLAGARS